MSPTQSLRSVVYASEATTPMTTGDLEALLVSARGWNRKNGITGVLLCSGNQFLQCIEGPSDAVQETYDRICRSRQHKGVVA
ncbi:MAG: BLUF domain-containing protein, partial [Candidatus Saccharibacteria bacterium]|nr:BLUF domain-containing protein [Rhodoferax sp.]